MIMYILNIFGKISYIFKKKSKGLST